MLSVPDSKGKYFLTSDHISLPVRGGKYLLSDKKNILAYKWTMSTLFVIMHVH